MSNYTKATNFAQKDGLSSGDPNKIIKGSEIDAEYNAIAAAIQSKANLDGPTFTGTPNTPTATAGTSSTQIASTAFVQAALIGAYPVGSIYMNATVATNPATLLGFGTWTAFGAGKVPVGLNAGDADFDTVEETGGTKDAIVPLHNHTATSIVTDPGHNHTVTTSNTSTIASGNAIPLNYLYTTRTTSTNTTGITVATTVANAGESVTGKNLQPYIVVYMWKRTA
jgi:hypothetical protein